MEKRSLVSGVFTTHIHKVVPAYAEFGGIFAHIFAEEAFVEGSRGPAGTGVCTV